MFRIVILTLFFIHCANAYQINEIPLPPLLLPDSLFWDAKTKNLYFVDFYSQTATICRYDYCTAQVICSTIEGESKPSFIIPLKNCQNLFAIGLDHYVKVVQWMGGNDIAKVVRTVFGVAKNLKSRVCKAVADSRGRFYLGTYNSTLCSGPAVYPFYRYNCKKKCAKKIKSDLHTTSGVVIDKKAKKLYQLDGCRGILSFDWDPKTGRLCNPCDVFDYNPGNSKPLVGLSVDTCGFLYSGTFGDSKILKIDPRSSTIVDEIKIPTEIIETPTFAGPNLDEIFVTTGRQRLNWATGDVINERSPTAVGSLYRITGYGSKGYPGTRATL